MLGLYVQPGTNSFGIVNKVFQFLRCRVTVGTSEGNGVEDHPRLDLLESGVPDFHWKDFLMADQGLDVCKKVNMLSHSTAYQCLARRAASDIDDGERSGKRKVLRAPPTTPGSLV